MILTNVPIDPVTMPTVANPFPLSRPTLLEIFERAMIPQMTAGMPVRQEKMKLAIPNTRLVTASPLVVALPGAPAGGAA